MVPSRLFATETYSRLSCFSFVSCFGFEEHTRHAGTLMVRSHSSLEPKSLSSTCNVCSLWSLAQCTHTHAQLSSVSAAYHRQPNSRAKDIKKAFIRSLPTSKPRRSNGSHINKMYKQINGPCVFAGNQNHPSNRLAHTKPWTQRWNGENERWWWW